MVEYLTTNSTDEGLTTRTSASTWRAPWNMPWGYLPSGIFTPANFNFTTAVGQSATFSPTLVANRKLQVFAFFDIANNTATGTIDTVTLYDNVAAAQIGAPLRIYTPGGASNLDSVLASTIIDAPAAGARAFRIRAISSLSAASQTIQNIQVWFTDIGPSGAPA